MALSMDEQRILAEIEHHLARSEPRLAARMAAFGHTRPSARSRWSPRTRVLAAIAATVMLAAAAVVVYALIAIRSGQSPGTGGPAVNSTHAPAIAPRAPASSSPAATGTGTQPAP